MATLKFAPWQSDVDVQFYAALAHIKINHDKLDDSARKVLGLYETRPGDHAARSMRVQIHPSALTSDDTPPNYCRAEGIIKNCNTIEDYKNLDRTAILDRCAQTIWDAIHDGSIYECPSLLSSFTAIIFANLKKYKFTYHFGFPAIQSDPPWKQTGATSKLSPSETTQLVDAVQTFKYSSDVRHRGFFLAKRVRGGVDSDDTPKTPVEDIGYKWAVGKLGAYEKGFFDEVDATDRFICFSDPSTYDENPGWPLRNLLILIRHRWQLHDANIICYRDTHQRREQPNSLILHLQSDPVEKTSSTTLPKVTGWERTEAGKLTSRNVDLSEYMDSSKLADQAVDLNLKLIKWRIAPTIDLDVIKNCKCLLLGAGTLGSYVSRVLLGWGVRKITFVDSANVSFSNPVRQPLFTFEDCLGGGAKKAERAAAALKEIYPGVDAQGHVMEVPMLGHPITEYDKTKENFEKLQALIDEHDAVFLLMDTRESRWLPTVMGKSRGKIVLNAALGFDTFVVMRHGLRLANTSGSEQQDDNDTGSKSKPEKQSTTGEVELGCYFCNDVVAPADSLRNATLDQQCTVTRPGIAPLASSLLVELLISILQHPLRARAAPPLPSTSTSTSNPTSTHPSQPAPTQTPKPSHPSLPPPFTHPLGNIPHTLRGFLSTFSTLQITGQPFSSCSACSSTVLSAYESAPWEFVKRALDERGWVEEMSGLAEVQRRAEEMEGDLEWDSEEEEGLEEEGELV